MDAPPTSVHFAISQKLKPPPLSQTQTHDKKKQYPRLSPSATHSCHPVAMGHIQLHIPHLCRIKILLFTRLSLLLPSPTPLVNKLQAHCHHPMQPFDSMCPLAHSVIGTPFLAQIRRSFPSSSIDQVFRA